MNGTGITLTDTSESFPISNLTADFVGTQTSPSSSPASGAASPSSSSSASAKSGAGTIGFEYGIMVLVVTVSMGGVVLVM
jgi:hypothetical protein